MEGENEKLRLQYSLDLPKPVYEILENDFWVLENVLPFMLTGIEGGEPLKFSASTSIYVRSGRGRAEINLRSYEIIAPCIVNIRAGEILANLEISDDFAGSFMVFSEEFGNQLVTLFGGMTHLWKYRNLRLFKIPGELSEEFNAFYDLMNRIQQNPKLQNKDKIYFHQTAAFFYMTVTRCISMESESEQDEARESNWLSDRFLLLVQKYYKKERFLKFYADKLQVSTKYLSKTVKQQTGVSAAELITRHVILEAKVLLKSSNLNVQQISVLLNFQSQSLFGKYFKTATGISPKDFRNS
ncbi:MAG: helix-turn-helix domain-containing protein [Muribaculaceae bacterium]|nr:helix-turn-helix domain-containing protein [Muribaculaceae bacterium]